MKKGIIITLIVILSIIAISCTVLLIMLLLNQGKLNQDWSFGIRIANFNNRNLQVQKEESFDITNIQTISLPLASSNVHIYKSETSEFKVVQKSSEPLEDDELFRSEIKGNQLSIIEKKKIKFHFLFWGTNWYSYDIYVPETYLGSLSITTSSGNIELHHALSTDALFLKSSSGNIIMEDSVKAQKDITLETVSGNIHTNSSIQIGNNFTTKTSSGDICFEQTIQVAKQWRGSTISGEILAKANITSESSQLSTTSGDIDISSLVLAKDFKVTSISGNIRFSNITGFGNIKTTSGDIRLEKFKMIGNTDIHSTSGNISAKMTEDSNCDIYDKTVSGDVSIPNNVRRMGSEPYSIFNVKTVSGSIRITK